MSYNEILVTRNLQSDGISRVVDGCHYVYLEYIDTYLGIPVYVSDNYLNDDPVLCGRKPTYGVIIRSSSILPHVDSEMVIVIERHVYNDPIIRDMIILHEIGHWVLGHIGSDIDIHVKEIDDMPFGNNERVSLVDRANRQECDAILVFIDEF